MEMIYGNGSQQAITIQNLRSIQYNFLAFTQRSKYHQNIWQTKKLILIKVKLGGWLIFYKVGKALRNKN